MDEVWAGRTRADPKPGLKEALCIASGPSLTAADCDLARGWRDRRPGRRIVIAINTSYRMARWADVLYAADTKWWRLNHEDALTFPGEKWTCSGEPHRLYGLHRCAGKVGVGLSVDPTTLHTGGNSGYQAVNLAYHFGARRIILLGYDMQHTGGKRHWHEDYPALTKRGDRMDNATPVAAWRMRFEAMARDLRIRKVRVENATRQTALTCFPRVALEDALGTDAAPGCDVE